MTESAELESRFSQFLEAMLSCARTVGFQQDVVCIPMAPMWVALEMGFKFKALPGIRKRKRTFSPPAFLDPEKKIIYYETPLSLMEANFIAAHELGHWLRGSENVQHWDMDEEPEDYETFVEYYNSIERPADLIAYQILAPEFLLRFFSSRMSLPFLTEYFLADPFHIMSSVIASSDQECLWTLHGGHIRPDHWFIKSQTPQETSPVRHLKDPLYSMEGSSLPPEKGKVLFLIDFENKAVPVPLYPAWASEFESELNERNISHHLRTSFRKVHEHPFVHVDTSPRWQTRTRVQIISAYANKRFKFKGKNRDCFVFETIEKALRSQPSFEHECTPLFPNWYDSTSEESYKETDFIGIWLNSIRKLMGLFSNECTFDWYLCPIDCDWINEQKKAFTDELNDEIRRYFKISPYPNGSYAHWAL
jgi:hypothetical protein